MAVEQCEIPRRIWSAVPSTDRGCVEAQPQHHCVTRGPELVGDPALWWVAAAGLGATAAVRGEDERGLGFGARFVVGCCGWARRHSRGPGQSAADDAVFEFLYFGTQN